jgi:hypothetical protein
VQVPEGLVLRLCSGDLGKFRTLGLSEQGSKLRKSGG